MKKLLLLFLMFSQTVYSQKATDHQRYFGTAKQPLIDTPQRIYDSVFLFKYPPDTVAHDLGSKFYLHNMYFDSIKFQRGANFSSSIFNNDAVFKCDTFKDFADFSSVTFKRDVNFTNCTFTDFLFLSAIQTDSLTKFFFYGAILPGLIDFSHNKTIYRQIDFTDANLANPARENHAFSDTRVYINLFDSDINKVKIDYLHFRLCFYDPAQHDDQIDALIEVIRKKRISGITRLQLIIDTLTKSVVYRDYISDIFPTSSYNDPLIKNFTAFYAGMGWFPKRLSRDQTEAVYSRLLKNFDLNGQKMSYEETDVARLNFLHSRFFIGNLWNRYGYDKWWIFLWTPGLLLILTILTYKFDGTLFASTKSGDALCNHERIPRIAKNFEYSRWRKFKYAFIYTSVIFFSLSIKTENINFKNKAFFYIITINALGLLCLAYLANFVLNK
jgi:hypothetical protein